MDALLHSSQEIPADALVLADRIIRAQEHVPLSPAEPGDGGVVLCAGACLAAAGLEIYGVRGARSEFERRLLLTRNSSLIVETFEELGWNPATARTAISQNDQSPAPARREIIRRMFLGRLALQPADVSE